MVELDWFYICLFGICIYKWTVAFVWFKLIVVAQSCNTDLFCSARWRNEKEISAEIKVEKKAFFHSLTYSLELLLFCCVYPSYKWWSFWWNGQFCNLQNIKNITTAQESLIRNMAFPQMLKVIKVELWFYSRLQQHKRYLSFLIFSY